MAPKVDIHLCPRYERAMEILGKRWTGLIINVLLKCESARFNELLSIIGHVSDRLLTERLRELEAEGIVKRTVYPESPVRVEYSLTEKGRDMFQAIEAIQSWAERWIPLETPEATDTSEAQPVGATH